MIIIKEIGLRRQDNLKIQMTKRMHHHIINKILLIKDKYFILRSISRAMEGRICSVGIVARIITGEKVQNIRVTDRIFIVLRRKKKLRMLERLWDLCRIG